MKNFLLIVLFSILLGGCAARLTPEQLKSADYGPYPENYKEIIKNKYNGVLFDPYSAVFTFREPKKHYARLGGFFGWAVCGTVNAKNRMGGYTGAKPFYILIRDDQVLREMTAQDNRFFLASGTCDEIYGQ